MILFPQNNKTKYYNSHYEYLLRLLEQCDEVKLIDTNGFTLEFCGKNVLIDYADAQSLAYNPDDYDAVFKYHYNSTICTGFDNIYPISPISFYNWEAYRHIYRKEITYTCNSDRLICNQRPYGDAVTRRRYVHAILTSKYGDRVDTGIVKQTLYWKKINDCLVSICVPGARNDILDRGQLQQMAFGCCTISPRLTDELPWGIKLEPDFHYICCKPDYSDLVEKIEWCKTHRQTCIEIGSEASTLFDRACTPEQVYSWMEICVSQ